jgi:hypothetical protein
MQPAMLGGRDFAGRARDQGPRALAGVPTDLDAKARSLRVELRPVGKVSGRRVKEPKQAVWRTLVDVGPDSPVQFTPITG